MATIGVRRLPPQPTPSLEVKTERISSVPSLTVTTGEVTKIPSLQVQTQSIKSVSSLQVRSEGVKNVTSLQGFTPLNPPPLEIKTEAVTTSGPTLTMVEQRSPDTATSQNSSFVTTQTVDQVNIPAVTGTGSVTATPTAYTNAVTTSASTTSAEHEVNVLGKRIRRQSTKYEDYEQHTITVRNVCPVC